MRTVIVALLMLLSLSALDSTGEAWASEAIQSSVGVECGDLPLLFRTFTRQHYAVKTIGATVQRQTVEKFIELLDPSKSLLLAADADRLRRDLVAEFEQAKKADCGLLNEAWGLLITRVADDTKLASSALTPKFKLNDNAKLVLDPEAREFATSTEARERRVRDMLEFQISNYLVAGLTLDAAKNQVRHSYELLAKRLRERRDKGALPGLWAQSFAEALDPHSGYMAPDDLADFEIAVRLSLEGIGAVLSSNNGFTVIQSLVPGGQAEKTGQLRPKDKIVAVAQEGEAPVPAIDMDLTDVVKLIRGKKGTRVTLTILREAKVTTTFNVTIERAKIDVSSQAAKISYQSRSRGDRQFKIGVIDLPSFYGGEKDGRSSTQDLKQLLEEARTQKADGIVLDLSRNGGGLLEEAVSISGLFIKLGAVVATKGSDGRVTVLEDTDPAVVWSGPLALLVSRGSASASEILAGSLRDYHRALIVGSTKTFGKGSVQVVVPLSPDVGAIRVTTSMFFLPGGQSTQIRGVVSDVVIPSVFDGFDIGEEKLSFALPEQNVAPFLSTEVDGSGDAHWSAISPVLVTSLVEKSKARVAADAGFKKIRKQLEDLAKDKGEVRLGDLRRREKGSVRRNGGGDEEERLEALQQTVLQESVNVLVDAVASGLFTSERPDGSAK
jgi:carboxyl-terminal processing protease